MTIREVKAVTPDVIIQVNTVYSRHFGSERTKEATDKMEGVSTNDLHVEKLTFTEHDLDEEANNTANSAIRLGKTDSIIKPADQGDESCDQGSWKLGLIMLALCMSVFCIALDNTIIATAIPHISDQFHTLQDVGLYGSAYLLTSCAVQLIFGRLYTLYPVKWVYLSAIFLFELGSLLCGATPNSLGLILGRAVAGLGAAGILSGALLIVNRSVPLRRRPTYIEFIASMYGIASVVGPLMGGAFTDHRNLTERSTFKAQLMSFDLEGTFLFVPGIVSLLLALQWSGSKYSWGNGRIITLLILFGVLITGFALVQVWKGEMATVPPRVFMNQTVWSCALFSSCLGAAFFVAVYYIPIWFQAIQGSSAVQSGIKNLPLILSLVIFSVISGAAVTILGSYAPFLIMSSILTAVGAGMLSTLEVKTGHTEWISYQIIFGVGVGMGMQQTMVAIQASLGASDVAIGTTIIIFAQTLGGAIFICVAQNVFHHELVANLAKGQIIGLDPASVVSVGATQVQSLIPQGLLPIALKAYNGAVTKVFYVSTAMAALSIIGALAVP